MQTTILCPGPSLANLQLADIAGSDFTICINRAIHRYTDLAGWGFKSACWCLLDRPLYETTIQTTPQLKAAPVLTLPRLCAEVGIESIPCHLPESQKLDGAGLYSIHLALEFAHILNPASIHLWGCDMRPAPDYDGVTLESNNRDQTRWERERAQIAPYLTSKVHVHR
jgi:hypothetical protein